MDAAFSPSPSFRDSAAAAAAASTSAESRLSVASGDGSPHWISADVEELNRLRTADNNGSNDEFEFTFSPAYHVGAPADEIFSDGTILPFFNRRGVGAAAEKAVGVTLRDLLNADRNDYSMSSSSTSVNDLDGVPPETFCLWEPRSVPPSPGRWRKSRSTGSASRRWRIRDLVFGRSHSDGKDRFWLASDKVSPEMEKGAKSSPGRKAVGKKGKAVDMVTAYKLYYAKGGGGNGGERRSFLPYRQDLVGLFSREHHPI